jgi:iron(III) transport system substrate-binding protein
METAMKKLSMWTLAAREGSRGRASSCSKRVSMEVVMMQLVVLALLCFVSPAHAAEQSWDALVAAAKREGKVVVTGPPDPQVRQTLPAAFKARYGITVEYLGVRTSDIAAKLRAERSAGLYTVDVVLGGIQTMATIFHREKVLDPIKPVLIMPEVVDASKWKSGKLPFVDPEQQYVLRLWNSVTPSFYINTQVVKPGDLRSARDLLDPKWRGKISAEDATLPGSGSAQAARYHLQLGEEFVKKLYIDQKPVISRERRQLTDWLIRGTYPIALNADEDEVERLRKEGMPVTAVFSLPDLPGATNTGEGQVGMFKNAPNPNAAKLFINWIASKEGLDVYARARGRSPTRNDIDERSFLPEASIPRPGVKYFDTSDWELTVTTKEKIRARMKELLGR